MSNFLFDDIAPGEYVKRLNETDEQTGGYNAVLGNLHTGSLWAHSNRGDQGSMELGNGLHAMSNGRLADMWPKMKKGLLQLKPMLTNPRPQTGNPRHAAMRARFLLCTSTSWVPVRE